MPELQPLSPTDTAPLLRPLLVELLALLRSLSDVQWNAPTVAGRWRVRDIAAHLLDGELRKIAAYRDRHALPLEAPIRSDADLARLVNGLNAEGVQWGQRLSARLLTDLLATTGEWASALLESLPPHGESPWPVSWAGEARSEQWMDTGREYTERWHHQMQIRAAVGAPPALLERRWSKPLLDLAVRALPRGLAPLDASEGASVVLVVEGVDGEYDTWTARREEARWALYTGSAGAATCTVRARIDVAWRILFNALSLDEARRAVSIEGDAALGEAVVRTRSIVM